MRFFRRAAGSVLFLVLAGLFSVSRSAVPPRREASVPPPLVAVRSGDLAPVPLRAPLQIGGRLSLDPGGAVVFTDRNRTALYAEAAGEVRTLARIGDRVPAGVLASVEQAAAAGDGSIAFRGRLADGREGLFRLLADGATLEVIVLTGDLLALGGGTGTVTTLSVPAVDGAGRVVAALDCDAGRSALARFAAGEPPEILLETGKAVDGGAFAAAITPPGAAPGGTIALGVRLLGGDQELLLLAPGALPRAVFSTFLTAGADLRAAAPAVNDAGSVAFLWSLDGTVLLDRFEAGTGHILAGPGTPVSGGGSLAAVTELPPAIDPAGGVVFAALMAAGGAGYFHARDTVVPLAVDGMVDGSGGVYGPLDVWPPQAAPAAGAAQIVVAAVDGQGPAITAVAPAGPATTRVRGGSVLGEPARFVSFFETGSFPPLGGGPGVAPGGSTLLFDARLTNGVRGLFRRDPDGRFAAVALEGDEAPGGGHFDGRFFSFHSISGSGVAAFLGAAPDSPAGTGLVLYRSGGPAAERLIGVGDPIPGTSALVSGFLPPSPVGPGGEQAIPIVQSDGAAALLGYDGTRLFRVGGAGDVIPGGARVAGLSLGAPSRRISLPPRVEDGPARVLAGLVLDDGRRGLYEMPLSEGGMLAAQRLLGTGDLVEGGILQPFELLSFDRGGGTGLAFQAQYDALRRFGTFAAGGAIPIMRPQDTIPGLGTVADVLPLLALAGEGRLAHGVTLAAGGEALLLRTPADPEPVTTVLAATGASIAGIGSIRSFRAPGAPPQPVARLGSNGAWGLAAAVSADEGPEAIVFFDARPNTPPFASAGPDVEVVCSAPGGTSVAFDGRGSADPDGDLLTYVWTGPFGTVTGEQPTVILPAGISTITLEVTDARGARATDTLTVSVLDGGPPSLAVAAVPNRLWPPNDELVPVEVSVQVSDRCDPAPRVVLRSVVIMDLAGADPALDVADADLGTDDRSLLLRAARGDAATPRLYALVYVATDARGFSLWRTALVRVPTHQGSFR